MLGYNKLHTNSPFLPGDVGEPVEYPLLPRLDDESNLDLLELDFVAIFLSTLVFSLVVTRGCDQMSSSEKTFYKHKHFFSKILMFLH